MNPKGELSDSQKRALERTIGPGAADLSKVGEKTVTIGVPSGGHPKVDFVNSLMQAIASGLISNVTIIPRIPVQQARTQLAERTKTTHLLFIDDDIVFEPSQVKALIDADKDVVSGLVVRRSNTQARPVVLKYNSGKFTWIEPPKELSKVGGVSLAFSLIKTSVFKKVGTGFRFTDHLNEDLEFMKRCHQKNIDVWFEPKAMVGHLTEVAL